MHGKSERKAEGGGLNKNEKIWGSLMKILKNIFFPPLPSPLPSPFFLFLLSLSPLRPVEKSDRLPDIVGKTEKEEGREEEEGEIGGKNS